jgi:pimeloyl-ACP methyl ester carboxylesterase
VRLIQTLPQPAEAAVDGVHYTVTGRGPQTLVLLHGFSDNLTTWNRVVPPLAVGNRVIAIDLPGFGRSSRAWQPALLDGYVDVVHEVLEAEGIEGPVALMGNSMGAAVAALFAMRFPLRTAQVVLIDMPGLRGVPRVWRLAMSHPAELGLRTALRVIGHGPARYGLGWAYSHIAAGGTRRLDSFAREGFNTPYAVRGSIPALLPIGRALVRELSELRLGALVGDLTVPVLLVFGSRDVLTPARVLRRLGPGGGAVVLPGCGHCPQIDQPEALLSQVVPFLREAATEAVGRSA